MYVSQKIQYALRALFELAKHYSESQDNLCRIQDVSERKSIPFKFLEGLLNELKKGFLVIWWGRWNFSIPHPV
ncbi:MAG: Rrf2 family transcriptional regulator [Deltaproteobacteria bacterium]|nr:Rrf2 family transcriptional regulator [Deltaproteobacteria bacterium]